MSDKPGSDLARLRWRCRRGMRELDSVLLGFVERSFDDLDEDEIERMTVILDLPDPELYAYLVGRASPEDPNLADLFRRIRDSVVPAT